MPGNSTGITRQANVFYSVCLWLFLLNLNYNWTRQSNDDLLGYTHTAPCIDDSWVQLPVCLLSANEKLIFLFFYLFIRFEVVEQERTANNFFMTNIRHLFSSDSSSFITRLSIYKKKTIKLILIYYSYLNEIVPVRGR